MKIAVIGIGLIGGSMAISLKESGFADTIIGVDAVREHERKALRRCIIDEAMVLDNAIKVADIIIVSTPVDIMLQMLPDILDRINDQQIVLEVGSTKETLAVALDHHPNRKQLILTHPMAGTEYSGPEAAIPNLFDNKCVVFIDSEKSADKVVETVGRLYEALQMHIVFLEAAEHDIHSAYVSHISHISSFALALTVLEKEKDQEQIFELASGGFSSTVRLAKSSPDMWIPIFRQNRDNVLDVLDEHINTLAKFRSLLIKKDFDQFYKLIQEANSIKRILK